MRYLVFGDVHGNLDALDVVLTAARAREIDGYFFLGDVVGYGPNPVECIDRLADLKQRGLLAWVAGNHELAVRGEVNLELYSAEAVATLLWTRQLLEAAPSAKHFVQEAATTLHVNEGVYLTHDSIVDPSSGRYHRTANQAIHELYSLKEKKGRIGFYGHTHSLRAELMEGNNVLLVPMNAHGGEGLDPHPLPVHENQIGWIGVGSVGFPTNPQRLTEYLIFDDEHWHIEKYAVAYPREQARVRARETLLPVCGQAVAERVAHWL